MTAHIPAILAEAHRHPASFLGSVYNRGMTLAKMKESVQSSYVRSLETTNWQTLAYQFESAKAKLVNKAKLFLPLIPAGIDQVEMERNSYRRDRAAPRFWFRRKRCG